MKKAILFLSLLLLPLSCFAISNAVWQSSHTATADTTKALCTSSIPGFFGSTPHAVLGSVCVNTGATTSSFTVYNSSASAINTLAIIDSTSKGCLAFNVYMSSGITYTNSSTADVTLTYQCY